MGLVCLFASCRVAEKEEAGYRYLINGYDRDTTLIHFISHGGVIGVFPMYVPVDIKWQRKKVI